LPTKENITYKVIIKRSVWKGDFGEIPSRKDAKISRFISKSGQFLIELKQKFLIMV
jgi:hypothetical protein